MASVVIAAGSNLGDREHYLARAGEFIGSLSKTPVRKSSVWESEPVGPAEFRFLNCVALLDCLLSPERLLFELKNFERRMGREINPERWRPRLLDLDIISYNSLVIQSDSLIIPHPEYHNRLFVLLPMQELLPGWTDPVTGDPIDTMIENAPELDINLTDTTW